MTAAHDNLDVSFYRLRLNVPTTVVEEHCLEIAVG